MARLTSINPETATGEAKTLLDAVAKKMGKAVNMTRVMALQPAVLEAYLGFSGALAKGALNPKTQHAIAHRLQGRSSDPRTAAIPAFAVAVTDQRGQVSDADLAAVRGAGIDDATIVEIVGNVALNTLTNLINNVADTDIDFPKVSVRQPALAA